MASRLSNVRLRGAFAILALLLVLTPLTARAWVGLGYYYPSGQPWFPYQGYKWAHYSFDHTRYLLSETSDTNWSQNAVGWIQNNGDAAALVFHYFKKDSNCYIPFNYRDQSYYTGLPEPSLIVKGAGCWQEGYEAPGPNELRIYFNPWLTAADYGYWGGATFDDMYYATYGVAYPWDGQVTFDTYYGNNDGYMTKYYFYPDGSVANP